MGLLLLLGQALRVHQLLSPPPPFLYEILEPKFAFIPKRPQNRPTLDCCKHNCTSGFCTRFRFSISHFGIIHYHYPSSKPQSGS